MSVRDRILRSPGQAPICEPCASCPYNCCNRFAVAITGFDITRILDVVDAKAKEFCGLCNAQNTEEGPHTHIFIFENGKLREKLLTMKRKKNMYCVFSFHSKGCGIWGAHPFICRTYPFVSDNKSGLKYTKNVACHRKWQKNEMNEEKIKALVEQMNVEIFEYNKIVREWNVKFAKDSVEEEFWEFLINKSKKKI